MLYKHLRKRRKLRAQNAHRFAASIACRVATPIDEALIASLKTTDHMIRPLTIDMF